MPPDATNATPKRSCGECSLCCTVLRVDELAKLGGTPCRHLSSEGHGCGIHAQRPNICRAYECLWLRGKLRDDDRPDKLGAVIDIARTGQSLRLAIREATPGAYDRSPRLQEIAAEFREWMPVRITDVDKALDPDRPFRLLLANGVEQRVAGETITTLRNGLETGRERFPWTQRVSRRITLRWQAWKLRRIGAR